MSVYLDEPKTVAELLARYREVKRRLYPARPRLLAAANAETNVACGGPAIAVAEDRQAENEGAENPRAVGVASVAAQSGSVADGKDRTGAAPTDDEHVQAEAGGDVSPGAPRRSARAALRAVSERTSVPVDAILGRKRRGDIAAARHEAVWRVRQATNWSLPRLGQFFGGRDHTTVLHSLRRMEVRAAQDPELRAYMDCVQKRCSEQRSLSR
jgi:hypothetical protein